MGYKDTIQQISSKIIQNASPYLGRKDYGNLRKGGFWGYEISNSEVWWRLIYEMPNNSTMQIGFDYFTLNKSFNVSGKRIAWREREPSILLNNLEDALNVFTMRISEIPSELNSITSS